MSITIDDSDFGAFAAGGPEGDFQGGLTKRQYAAIHLRKTGTNTEWLDDMIFECVFMENMRAALASGLYPGDPEDFKGIAEWCVAVAEALIETEQP